MKVIIVVTMTGPYKKPTIKIEDGGATPDGFAVPFAIAPAVVLAIVAVAVGAVAAQVAAVNEIAIYQTDITIESSE